MDSSGPDRSPYASYVGTDIEVYAGAPAHTPAYMRVKAGFTSLKDAVHWAHYMRKETGMFYQVRVIVKHEIGLTSE